MQDPVASHDDMADGNQLSSPLVCQHPVTKMLKGPAPQPEWGFPILVMNGHNNGYIGGTNPCLQFFHCIAAKISPAA